MKLRARTLVPLLALVFSATFFVVGCAALDKAAPDFAGHPAVPATTQPSPTNPNIIVNIPAQPATQSNVPAQLGEVLQKLSANQGAQAVASTVPWGSLALTLLGMIGSGVVYVAAKKSGNTQGAQSALLSSVQDAAGAATAIAGVSAAHAAIATSNAPPTPAATAAGK